jgi:hypothetical protein
MSRISESQRDSIPQPGVDCAAGYPGLPRGNIINPEGVASADAQFDATPLGLKIIGECAPRVVAPLQPWAEGRSPVGANPLPHRPAVEPQPKVIAAKERIERSESRSSLCVPCVLWRQPALAGEGGIRRGKQGRMKPRSVVFVPVTRHPRRLFPPQDPLEHLGVGRGAMQQVSARASTG